MKWTAERCKAALEEFVFANSRPPTHKELDKRKELPCDATLKKVTGQNIAYSGQEDEPKMQ
jgi:hypothetical protein